MMITFSLVTGRILSSRWTNVLVHWFNYLLSKFLSAIVRLFSANLLKHFREFALQMHRFAICFCTCDKTISVLSSLLVLWFILFCLRLHGKADKKCMTKMYTRSQVITYQTIFGRKVKTLCFNNSLQATRSHVEKQIATSHKIITFCLIFMCEEQIRF